MMWLFSLTLSIRHFWTQEPSWFMDNFLLFLCYLHQLQRLVSALPALKFIIRPLKFCEKRLMKHALLFQNTIHVLCNIFLCYSEWFCFDLLLASKQSKEDFKYLIHGVHNRNKHLDLPYAQAHWLSPEVAEASCSPLIYSSHFADDFRSIANPLVLKGVSEACQLFHSTSHRLDSIPAPGLPHPAQRSGRGCNSLTSCPRAKSARPLRGSPVPSVAQGSRLWLGTYQHDIKSKGDPVIKSRCRQKMDHLLSRRDQGACNQLLQSTQPSLSPIPSQGSSGDPGSSLSHPAV